MRNTNKKGFTIVELVIVVAVIAILAAVLIPTFSGIIRKANISSDTVVAKNLNTAAIAEGAETFDEAIAAVKEAGYLIANLNAKATDCYFVWEDDSNQFVLYDLKNDKILYSNTAVSGDPDASWCFAVNNSTDESAVQAAHPSATIKKTLASINDLADALAKGGTIYMDESVVIDGDNTFDVNGGNIVLELGNATLTTQNALSTPPVNLNLGSLTVNNGNLGGAGQQTNHNGTFNTTVQVGTTNSTETTELILNGTTVINEYINTSDASKNGSGIRAYRCNVSLKDVTIDVAKASLYIACASQATLENVNATSATFAPLALSHSGNSLVKDGANPDPVTSMTINGGVYKNTNTNTATANTSSNSVFYIAYGAKVEIEDGVFSAANGKIFHIEKGTVTITDGTFNDATFEELCSAENPEAAWAALCTSSVTVTIADGVVTLAK